MKHILILIMMTSFVFGGDAKQIEVIDLPFKEATMLKGYSEVMDISIHAKSISEDLQESYFDQDLTDDNVYPVLVRITNNSMKKVLLHSMDAKLISQEFKLNRYPLENVITPYQESIIRNNAILGTIGNFTTLGMRLGSGDAEADSGDAQARSEAIRNEFYKKSLKEKLLYPGDTISGFVFFNIKEKNQENLKASLNVKMQFMNSLRKYDLKTDITK